MPCFTYRWLDSETTSAERIADLSTFAEALAQFLIILQPVEPAGGSLAGPRSQQFRILVPRHA